ncbi:MAG: acyltransferase [Sphingomonadaceae bacterium]|nr:acyltransferase [Sphingomonadaceae bacterium]
MAIAAPAAQRIGELTALRGLAALVVLLSHLLLIYPLSRETLVAAGLLINPHGAIVLFFVLSGFVLARSLERAKRSFWGGSLRFWLKRLFRIYPAVWAVTTIAVVLILIRPDIPEAQLARWPVHHMASLSRHNVVLTLAAWNAALIPPLWTIYVELVGSLFVPFMVWIGRRATWAGWLMIGGLALLSLIAEGWHHPFSAAIYMVHFALGVMLALYGIELRKRTAIFLALAGLAGLTVFRTIFFLVLTGQWKMGTYDYGNPLPGLFEAAAATMLVAALAFSAKLPRWLLSRPLQALGDWSYPLYLLHLPIMLFLACLLPASAPGQATLMLGALSIAITLLLSATIHHLVEQPGIALGNSVVDRVIRA